VIIGDLNIDILENNKKEKTIVEKYENLLAAKGFEAKVNSPTRQEMVNGRLCESCIDHIFVRIKEGASKGYVWKKKISDHYFTILTVDINETKSEIPDITAETYHRLNDDKIVNEMQNIDWRFLNSMEDINRMYDTIKNIIQEIYEKNTQPNHKDKEKNVKPRKPWMNPLILSKIEIKNKLWKMVVKTRDNTKLQEYKKIRNEITSLIAKAKQSYYNNLFENAQTDSKKIWNNINTIAGKCKKIDIDANLKNNFPNTNIKDLCNRFNVNFSQVVPKLKSKYQTRYSNATKKFQTIHQTKIKGMEHTKNSKSIGIRKATIEDTCSIIGEIKLTNAAGIDGIMLKHLKNSKFNSAIMITILINKIIDTEVWPDELKIQVLRPIYKNGKKSDINNYRPISLLPVINKIMEKFFANQILNFFDKNCSFNKKQFGFKKKCGTNMLLNEINDKIAKALGEGKYVGAVLIDLQKAFDTINHKILMDKCSRMGIRGKMYNIVNSYMSNRKAAIKIHKTVSDFEKVNFGVPQGSVLGPLLFLIYINDLDYNINKTLVYLFADDIIVISVESDYGKMMENLQQDFDKIGRWCIDNELFVNENKTQCVAIASPHKHTPDQKTIYFHLPNCDNLNCDKECFKLKVTKEVKYLGLVIDSKWSYKKHIEKLILRLRQMMPSLYKVKYVLDIKNKKNLYFAWVESLLRYGIEIYGQAAESHIERIQKLQNKIIKILFKSNQSNCSTKDIYYKYKLLNVRQLRDFVIISNNYYSENFKNTCPDKTKKFRQSTYRYEVPFAQNEYGKHTRNYTIPKLFNKIPTKLLNITKIGRVKKELRLYLLDNCWGGL
jgi:hypothetical protein